MRHVSRTHRVALGWLFDRINLTPKFRSGTLTPNISLQTLTKENFTRDEWNNLLHLFDISHFSSLCCAENFSLISCSERVEKRMQQEQSEEHRVVAKSRPMVMNLVISVPTCSSSVNSPIASKSWRILKASSRQIECSGKTDVRSKRNSNPDAASSSQGWQKDALLDVCTGKPVATDERPGISELSGDRLYRETSSSRIRRISRKHQELQVIHKNRNPTAEFWPHHSHVSPDYAPHM